MNKFGCLISLALLLAFSARSQSYFGVEMSGTFTSITGSIMPPPGTGHPETLFDKDLLPGFAVGVWGDIRVSDYLNLEPHLNFMVKGYSFQSHSSAGSGGGLAGSGGLVDAGSIGLDYLSLPLNLLYRIPGEYDDFFVGGGMYGAYLVNGNYALGAMEDEPSALGIRSWDVGWTGVLSYRWYFGLTVSASYSQGFLSLRKGGEGKEENQVGGLSFGYLIHYNTKE